VTAFTQAVELYCQGLDSVAVGCLGAKCEHAYGDAEHSCEASFSGEQCDSCGSTYAGDRLPGFGMWQDGDTLHCIDMTLCVDCVMWHANGEEPTEDWYQSPGDYRAAGGLSY
jgi:hypothetical protein